MSYIIAGRDAAAFVQSAVQLDHDLAGPVIVDELKITDVIVLLHQLQELNYNL